MSDTGRSTVIYVTADSSRWLLINVPAGMIPPPSLRMHQPLEGHVEFLYAECYQLAVPDAAKQALRDHQKVGRIRSKGARGD